MSDQRQDETAVTTPTGLFVDRPAIKGRRRVDADQTNTRSVHFNNSPFKNSLTSTHAGGPRERLLVHFTRRIRCVTYSYVHVQYYPTHILLKGPSVHAGHLGLLLMAHLHVCTSLLTLHPNSSLLPQHTPDAHNLFHTYHTTPALVPHSLYKAPSTIDTHYPHKMSKFDIKILYITYLFHTSSYRY